MLYLRQFESEQEYNSYLDLEEGSELSPSVIQIKSGNHVIFNPILDPGYVKFNDSLGETFMTCDYNNFLVKK